MGKSQILTGDTCYEIEFKQMFLVHGADKGILNEICWNFAIVIYRTKAVP